MDTELARTFLMVAATGNFVAAASRLHVTQSTVSARIHTLETTLGARLFQRGRNGAELTAAGKRFLRHAKHLVRTVEQARHDVGLPQGFRDVLTVSGRIALWEGFLPHWVAWMRGAAPPQGATTGGACTCGPGIPARSRVWRGYRSDAAWR